MLERKIKQEFNRILLAGFDELNVIRVREMTESIWKRIDKFNRAAYREQCEWVWEWVYDIFGYGEEAPAKDWTRIVDNWLRGYDPVTKYIYDREMERKRLRLNEGILATRETQDRPGLTEVVKTAANLLLTQSLQYGLDLIAQVQTEAYDALDVDEVQYHACNDDRTCGECWKDDGKIYRLEEAPKLPRHYRCRCWYTPVK